jgi:hypothetical protein
MPELSRFYGIIIRMFSEPSERHHGAHFHAYYGEPVAVFSIFPVALVIGFIPQRQQRLVEAWAELHDAELRRTRRPDFWTASQCSVCRRASSGPCSNGCGYAKPSAHTHAQIFFRCFRAMSHSACV